MQPTILVIEDNADVQSVIIDTLSLNDYHVLTADTGASGLVQARERDPDLIILDLGLPDFKGDEVARRVRKTSDVPILVLTAMDDVGRKVALFAAGATDYLTKPFHPNELLARVHVQLRPRPENASLKIGRLSIFIARHLVLWDDQPVLLSARELELLLVFTQVPGRVFSRAELRTLIWDDDIDVSSNVLDVHMANLRAKFRDVDAYGVIRTVRGYGYGLKV